jgi:hypothetical protein
MNELTKVTKYATAALLILLASTMLLVAFNLNVYAQDQEQYPYLPNPNTPPTPPPEPNAIVVVVASVGGTTDPQPGTYTYTYGDTITLTATPNTGYKFQYWIISGTYLPGHPYNVPPITYPADVAQSPDWIPNFPPASEAASDNLVRSENPLTVICGYGYTMQYQPVFAPTAAPSAGNESIVIVLAGAGGTTDPVPGTYSYLPDIPVTLTATPNSGFEFQYWIATGTVPGHDAVLTDQSLSINCQQGYTYTYQPVFKPSAATVPSTGVDPTIFYVIIVVLAIIAIVAIALAVMRGKK